MQTIAGWTLVDLSGDFAWIICLAQAVAFGFAPQQLHRNQRPHERAHPNERQLSHSTSD